MAQGVRDAQTSAPGSAAMEKVPDGVRFRRVNTLVDERGSLCEMFDERWDWPTEPLRLLVLLHDPARRREGLGAAS